MTNYFHKITNSLLRRILYRKTTKTPENWHEDFIIHLAKNFQPKVYVELGLYRCQLFNQIIPHANQLIGVDIEEKAGEFMRQMPGKTRFFHGPTALFAKELKKKPIKIDLLFIDADHSAKAVEADFKIFFPFVADNGLILMHDGFPKNKRYTQQKYCGDGYRAIDMLTREAKGYEIMTIPIHPGLTLVRKRKTQVPWTK